MEYDLSYQADMIIEEPIHSPRAKLKRKGFEEAQEFEDVLRSIKKIKFPSMLHVKTLNGRIFDLEVSSCELVLRVKELLFEREGIPISQQKLIFKGQQLDDTKPLNAYGLQEDGLLFMVLALPHRNGYSGISSEHRVAS